MNPLRSKHCAKETALNEDAVRSLRKRVASGESMVDLAREYGVGYSTIRNAVNGVTWSWVQEVPEQQRVDEAAAASLARLLGENNGTN